MARYAASVESQAAQAAGATSGSTTYGGYFAAVVGGTNGLTLRRVQIGVRAGATTPTSQQMTIGIYRQTGRAVGALTNTVGNKLDPYSATSGSGGVDVTTGTTATTAPTFTGPLYRVTFNTQSTLDLPFELLEQLRVSNSTTDGICFANIGSALPASHLFTLSVEWEE